MKIVFAAKGRRGLVCLQSVLTSNHQVGLVILPVEGSEEIDRLARSSRIQVIRPNNINSPTTVCLIAGVAADVMVLAGYTQILHDPILSKGAPVIINLHGGRLPKYRGGSPINWQIINAEKEGGCAVCHVNHGIDTGDIIYQEIYPIYPDEGATEIIAKTLQIFPKLLVKTLNNIEEGCAPREIQDENNASYFRKRRPEDGQIFWGKSKAIEIHNLVRALRGPDLPGAFCYYGDDKLFIHRTSLLAEEIKGIPGRVYLGDDGRIIVIAKDRGLIVHHVRLSINHSPILGANILSPGQILN